MAAIECLESRRLLSGEGVPQTAIDGLNAIHTDLLERFDQGLTAVDSGSEEVVGYTVAPAANKIADALSDIENPAAYLPSFTPGAFLAGYSNTASGAVIDAQDLAEPL